MIYDFSFYAAGVHIDWASSFYMIVYTNLGIYLEVQLTPVMQLYIIIVDPAYKEKMCGNQQSLQWKSEQYTNII